MNYFTRDGIVGKYKGIDVWVIDYRSFKKEMDDGAHLFAVKVPDDNNSMKLVFDGIVVGRMSSGGNVHDYEVRERMPYKYFEPALPPHTEDKADVFAGYGYYSQTVDNFFKGLSKLWEEIDNSFVED